MATAPAPARPRPGGGRLFIIVGLLLAILAGAGVFFLGGTLGGGGGSGPSINVVVAATSISQRSSLRLEDLAVEKVNGTFVNTYKQASDAVGKIAEINISKGTIITSDMLVVDLGSINASTAPAYLPLAQGYVAITVPTSEQQGVAGHITIGDYITMIASAQTTLFQKTTQASGPPTTVVKTVFTNVRVIGVGPAIVATQPASGTGTTTGSTGAVGGVSSSLTLEVTQCDAEYLVWFRVNTQMTYTLESFKDYLTQPTAPDASCPNVLAAKGVTADDVNKRFSFTK